MTKASYKILKWILCLMMILIMMIPSNAAIIQNEFNGSEVIIGNIEVVKGKINHQGIYSKAAFKIDLKISDAIGLKSISLVDENKANQPITLLLNQEKEIATQIIFDDEKHHLLLANETSFIAYDGNYLDFSKIHLEVENSYGIKTVWYFISDNINGCKLVKDKVDDQQRYPIIYDNNASKIKNLEFDLAKEIVKDGYYQPQLKLQFDVEDESMIQSISIYGFKINKTNQKQLFCLYQFSEVKANQYHFTLLTTKNNQGLQINLQEENYGYFKSCYFNNQTLSYLDLSQLKIEVVDVVGNCISYYLKQSKAGYELVNEIDNKESYPIIIDNQLPTIIMKHQNQIINDQIIVNSKKLSEGYVIDYKIADNYQIKNSYLTFKVNDEIKTIEINQDGKLNFNYDLIKHEYYLDYHGQQLILMKQIPDNNQIIDFSLEAIDKCNNEIKQDYQIIIDDYSPVVKELSTIDGNILKENNFDEYQLFSNQEIKLKMLVEDKDGDVIKNVASLQYALVDNKYDLNLKWQSIKLLNVQYSIDKHHAFYYFTLPQQPQFYQKYLKIRIVDYYDNESNFNSGGIIYQNRLYHDLHDQIKINFDSSHYVGSFSIGNRGKIELYNGEVDTTIHTIEEAGIKSFDLYLNTNHVNQWENEETLMKQNIVVAQKKKLRLKEGNNQEVMVIVDDCVGNNMMIKKQISIDMSAPKVMIDIKDKNLSNYYNHDCIVKIRVRDANIDEQILNKSSKLIYLQDGMMHEKTIDNFCYVETKNGEDIYEGKIVFKDDGNYQLKQLWIKDYANNIYNNQNLQERMVIDCKTPLVNVFDDQSEAKKYYQQPRKIIFHLSEKNFDAQKMQLFIYNEKQQLLSSHYLNWQKQNDYYQATYNFEQEGGYSFRLIGEDKAGNKLKTYESTCFYLDFQDPLIEMDVHNNDIFNHDSKMRIVIKDDNLDYDKCLIKVSMGDKSFDLNKTIVSKSKDKKIIELANIPKLKQYDGIYHLEVRGVDKANRSSSRMVHFTINRFGSSFHLLTSMDRIIAKPKEIIIDEYNVSPIKKIVIRINHNYLTTDLKQGKDYRIERIDDGIYHNRYYLPAKLFKEDGYYTISLVSVDEAGHHNYSKNKQLKLELTLDQSKPIIHISNIEANRSYNEEYHDVMINLFDNSKIKDIKIWVNDKQLRKQQYHYQESSGSISFRLNDENYRQKIEVLVTDEAGNENRVVVDNILVTHQLINQSNVMIIIALIAIILIVVMMMRSKCKKQEK